MNRFGGLPVDTIGNRFGGVPVDTGATTDKEQFEAPIEEPIKEEGLGQRLGERASDVGQMITRRAPLGERSKIGAAGEILMEAPGTIALGAGQAIGAAGDIIGTGFIKGLGYITPDIIKDWTKDKAIKFAKTDVGQFGLKALSKGHEEYLEFKEKNPDAAMAVEGIVNVWGAGIVKSATKPVVKTAAEVADISGDISRAIAKASPGRVNQLMTNEVKTSVSKAIRPTLGKLSPTQKTSYFKKATDAVEDIIENKTKFKIYNKTGEVVDRLPETVDEFAQTIQQRKKQIFKQYDTLAKATKGNVVEVTPITRILNVFSKNKTISDLAPKTKKYALERIQQLTDGGPLTATDAQNHIQLLNASLKTYNANPTFDAFGKVQVDAIIANNMRKLLDRQIKSATGKEYAILKKAYGNLKTIEKDVNKAVTRIANKADANVLDIGTDIFSSHQAVSAIARHDPTLLSAAAAAKTARWYTKMIGDPDKKIKKMFKNAEKLYEKKQAFAPKSATIKRLARINKKTQ